jgi:Xaa-Pro aminopeptidase
MKSIFPPSDDLQLRYTRLQTLMKAQQADACLLYTSVNLYYLTGAVFDGYIFLPVEGDPLFFVRKSGVIEIAGAQYIRKPEEIPPLLSEQKYELPRTLALEADQLTFNEYQRLLTVFQPERTVNATQLLRQARMIKTPWEIEQFRYSSLQHTEVYKHIPALFEPGMSDLELQYEIERVMRKHGSIGLFRTFGSRMDIFMGSILTGDNAASPSPCDYALGGEGMQPCIPVGANDSIIGRGQTVMVDMIGNYTAYMTDMTRVFAHGDLPAEAYSAHQVSIDLNHWLLANARPGMTCAEIYEHSLQAAADAGFAAHFMGIAQQAKFVGHGIGIEVNELPVLSGRSKEILRPGMVFAFEPKFVLPKVGAVGIEDTYLVTDTGLEKLTNFEEEIIDL